MRTTLDIDEDILLAAKDMARRQKRTAGEVISALARSALTQAPRQGSVQEAPGFYGFEPFPPRGGVVSNELINKLREDDVY